MFYNNKNKIVPSSLELLTPLALSHWISQDGSLSTSKGIYLCTDKFKPFETILLANYLTNTFGLKCFIHPIKWRISKSSKSTIIYNFILGNYFLA